MTIPKGSRIASVAAGADHVVALSDDGTIYAWGRNNHGQLGDGTTTDRHSPVSLTSGRTLGRTRVTGIAAGNALTAAVTKDGRLLTWGRKRGRGRSASSVYDASNRSLDTERGRAADGSPS